MALLPPIRCDQATQETVFKLSRQFNYPMGAYIGFYFAIIISGGIKIHSQHTD